VVRRHGGQCVGSDVTDRTVQTILMDAARFACVNATEDVFVKAGELVLSHRLRSADALHLASALRLAELAGTEIVFVASDGELLRAALAEGFPVLDPVASPAVPHE